MAGDGDCQRNPQIGAPIWGSQKLEQAQRDEEKVALPPEPRIFLENPLLSKVGKGPKRRECGVTSGAVGLFREFIERNVEKREKNDKNRTIIFSKFLENFHKVLAEIVLKLSKILNNFPKICSHFSLNFTECLQNFYQICTSGS